MAVGVTSACTCPPPIRQQGGRGHGCSHRCRSSRFAPTVETSPRPGARSERDTVMPLINVKLIEGVFDASQKQQIVRDLTDALVAIEGENMRPVTWCVVEEGRSGD